MYCCGANVCLVFVNHSGTHMKSLSCGVYLRLPIYLLTAQQSSFDDNLNGHTIKLLPALKLGSDFHLR
jgi:hypothetical protein